MSGNDVIQDRLCHRRCSVTAGLFQRPGERPQPGIDIARQVHTQKTPAALGEHVEIAARLRRLDDAEAVGLTRHRHILGGFVGDLQEHAAVRPAFVGLPGRMQEARTEADAGRGTGTIADHSAHALQRLDMRRVAVDIGEQRDIAAGIGPAEMRLQRVRERRGAGQNRRVRRIGEDGNSVKGRDRLLLGQSAGLLEGVGQLAGLVLRSLDIGLVERVDADDRTRHRRRHLQRKNSWPICIASETTMRTTGCPAASSAATALSCS